MQAFEWSDLLARQRQAGKPWLEFLRVPTLSAGVYHLKAAEEDRQMPHTEDEVYYVVSGQGRFRAAAEQRAVAAGSVIFVESGLEHRFFDITEDLTVLVFFAPPEGSRVGT